VLTFGKGLGGSGVPIAGLLTEERLAGLAGHHINSTFGGNVLASAVAAKTIEIIGRPGFLENVREVGAYLMGRLRDLATRVRCIADVRGVGLMIGVEVVDRQGNPSAELTRHLAEVAQSRGLLMRTSLYGFGNVLKVRPALTLQRHEAAEMCGMIEDLFVDVDREAL
jgi:4-aminobutyrate aminotransferase